ncbi:hypothetical protein FRB93_000376 [Tulasnella sp. JGI-2019a]|nr:hypothetical protein FRB93_000376 [Tulasnella sp. JGI-2019a]
MLTVAFTGTISKLFLKFACAEVKVVGLPYLLDALAEENRVGRGVITVSNHISVLDDPLMWGILPWHYYLSSRKTRWTLGASDIIFTNKIFSHILRNGQVIETFRGDGIHQKAVDLSIEKLNQGDWIHIFPEGKVNQVRSNPNGGLLRFKWGVAHMMLKSKATPRVIPMYLEGFDDIMPSDRGFPRFIPRFGKRLRITFGDPSGVTEQVLAVQEAWKVDRSHGDADPEAQLRMSLADVLQQAVKRLGDDVTGSKSS